MDNSPIETPNRAERRAAQSNKPERRALTLVEFCDCYRLSRTSAYKLINEGKLKTVLIAGRRLVPVDAAEALLQGAA